MTSISVERSSQNPHPEGLQYHPRNFSASDRLPIRSRRHDFKTSCYYGSPVALAHSICESTHRCVVYIIRRVRRGSYVLVAIFTPAMWGFNVSSESFPYDNRPVAPLTDYTFDQWWFHGHLNYPPNPGDFFYLPAGKPATAELACHKGATSYCASADGGVCFGADNYPCPGSPISQFHSECRASWFSCLVLTICFDRDHSECKRLSFIFCARSSNKIPPLLRFCTQGLWDLKGCALAIAYESNVTKVQPEDFTIFSVNHTCVWYKDTDFQVPARMPPCPEGGCICAWFWIHSEKSGGQQSMGTYTACSLLADDLNLS